MAIAAGVGIVGGVWLWTGQDVRLKRDTDECGCVKLSIEATEDISDCPLITASDSSFTDDCRFSDLTLSSIAMFDGSWTSFETTAALLLLLFTLLLLPVVVISGKELCGDPELKYFDMVSKLNL